MGGATCAGAQLAQGLRLDLADALARHVELFSDLFKRPGETVGQAEPVIQHLTFAVGQRRQDFLEAFLQHRVGGLLRRIFGGRIGNEVAVFRVVVVAYLALKGNGLLRHAVHRAHLVGLHLHLGGEFRLGGLSPEALD